MAFTDATRKQLANGLILHYAASSQTAFENKLNELQREIHQLQLTFMRLQQANRRDPRPAIVHIPTENIRVVHENVEDQLAVLHGWILSLVETLFTLVRLEMGPEHAKTLRDDWKRYF